MEYLKNFYQLYELQMFFLLLCELLFSFSRFDIIRFAYQKINLWHHGQEITDKSKDSVSYRFFSI